MMTCHRLIKIGNSIGITIPKKFLESTKMSKGDKITIEFNTKDKTLFVKPSSLTYDYFLSPNYFKWLTKTVKELRKLNF